jgi:SAM-dependent methyltransferase
MKVDITLLAKSLFKNPFRVSKKFLKEQGATNIYAYGETPLTSLSLIAENCRISQKDVVFELGCGRGRSCFWLNCFLGCRVVGIEYIPEFVNDANEIKDLYHLSNVNFRNEDMLTADLSEATMIYLYGTCLEDTDIKKLITKFEKLRSGTKIITVSYSLLDYTDTAEPFFKIMKVFPAEFTWGTADVYLHHRT